MWEGYIYFGFSKEELRFKNAIAKECIEFNVFFTKAFMVLANFTVKEDQIINLIKSNEIAVIMLMIFTRTLTKTLS